MAGGPRRFRPSSAIPGEGPLSRNWDRISSAALDDTDAGSVRALNAPRYAEGETRALPTRLRSAATIMAASSSRVTRGSQPSSALALAASPRR